MPRGPVPLCGTVLLYGLILLAVAIQAMWFLGLARSDDLLAWSNYGQLASALLCVVLSTYLFARNGERIYVVAGFAFGGWFLSNTFWFLDAFLIGRSLVYPGVSDAGFLGFMLLAAAAIRLAYPKTPRPQAAVLIYAALLLPGIAGLAAAFTSGAIVALAYYLCFALVISTIWQYYDSRDALIFAGALLYCATMLLYILRELYFPGHIAFTLVGQLAIISFCVLQLGLLRRVGRGRVEA